MTSVSLSEEGDKKLERLKETFEIKPSNRKAIEKSVEVYLEQRLQRQNKLSNNNNE